jgi:hypothetical protein
LELEDVYSRRQRRKSCKKEEGSMVSSMWDAEIPKGSKKPAGVWF